MNFPKKQISNFFTEKRASKSYSPPGSIDLPVNLGTKKKAEISLFSFDENSFTETKLQHVSEIKDSLNPKKVNWINLDGIDDAESVNNLGKIFNLHPLTIEDIINTDQRAKFEDYNYYIALMLKMLYLEDEIKTEQLCIILTENTVITFQEHHGDPFEAIRERIRQSKGRIRKMPCDYLAYALVDAVVDSYFILLDKFGDELDLLEHELNTHSKKDTLKNLQLVKRQLLLMRKLLFPTREMITLLQRDETTLIKHETDFFIRDLLDHIVRVIETVDTYKDIVVDMIDTYRSNMSNRMNETMKILTIISTIFIPLTFIVGVYGMNFKYMPELDSVWGYPLVWLVMIVTSVSLIIYFKRKNWL
ncbi:MAG: magnesium/cobalt transporter CorA, partial [Bacteroidia bacterium]|jgi:magnesium transporter